MSTKATVFHGDWWHIYRDLREELNDGKYGVYIQVDHQGEVFVPEEVWSDMQEQIRLAAPATREQVAE